MGLSVDEDGSIIPYTLGSPLYQGQEAALVIVFHDSDQQQKATTFIAALRDRVVSPQVFLYIMVIREGLGGYIGISTIIEKKQR